LRIREVTQSLQQVCGCADPSFGPGGHEIRIANTSSQELEVAEDAGVPSAAAMGSAGKSGVKSVGLMLPTAMRLSSNPSCAPFTQTWFKAAATAGA